MKKKKTINIEPYYLETIKSEGRFLMKFYADNKIVKMKLPRWWVGYIAEQLHSVLNYEQNEINNLRKKCREG